jgi:hypothetical protein
VEPEHPLILIQPEQVCHLGLLLQAAGEVVHLGNNGQRPILSLIETPVGSEVQVEDQVEVVREAMAELAPLVRGILEDLRIRVMQPDHFPRLIIIILDMGAEEEERVAPQTTCMVAQHQMLLTHSWQYLIL